MTKTSLLTSTALTSLILASPAIAADMPVKAAPRPVIAAAPTYSWTGFYIGMNLGGGWGHNETSCSFTDPGSVCDGIAFPKIRSSGVIGGAQVGGNWQTGNFVFGLESDFNWTGIHGETQFPSVFPNGDPGKTDEVSARYDWLGTARARAGVATGWGMYYATGGLAFGRVQSQYIFDVLSRGGGTPDHVVFSSTSTRTGWTAGGGAEFALTGSWTFKVEYLYVDLGKTDVDITAHPANGAATTVLNFDNKLNIVRAGLNLRF